MGYFLYILLTMLIAPIACILNEYFIKKEKTDLIETICKWFIFWTIGIRLLTAGLSQIFNPSFTANILGIDLTNLVIVQELGFANLLFGIMGISSIYFQNYRIPATSGGIFLGMAGLLHVSRIFEDISFKESVALVSDLFIFFIVIFYYIGILIKRKSNI
ncbi:MAG: hypothetical protein JJT78_10880 [Leptospira sp.]|nr:hypothetical protein [Leptospira sp.]